MHRWWQRPLVILAAWLLFAGPMLSAGPITAAAPAVDGAVLWTRRYNGPGNAYDNAQSLAASPDGTRIFVTGWSWNAGTGYDYATFTYDAASGAALWARRYNGPGNGADEAKSIASSPDGSRIFVTGNSIGAGTDSDYATIAYDAATGTVLWAKRYNGPGNNSDEANSIAASPDGSSVFVTGHSYGGLGTGYDYATIAYDAATGTVLWARRYTGPGNATDGALSVATSAVGSRVLVTGLSGFGTSFDSVTIAYDGATGFVVWARRFNGPANGQDAGRSVTTSLDGSRVFVTGYSAGAHFFLPDFATIAYDATTGAVLWARLYNGPGDGYDAAWSVAASPDGSSVFVTGQSYGAGMDYDYATIAYDAATGAVRWAGRYIGRTYSDDYAYAVAVSPDGTKVFVTGQSSGGGTAGDYATIAYQAATATVLWVSRYDGPGNRTDSAFSLAPSPDGSRVFVTGQSAGGPGAGFDYATIAYEA
jgi:dienelactone hydrolase